MNRFISSSRSPLLSAVGAVLTGVAFLVVAIRRDSADVFGDAWGDGGIFLTFAVPAALLLGIGLFTKQPREPTAWRTVSVVFGLLFVPLALAQLVDWVASTGDSGNPLNVAWIFAVTAAIGFYAGVVAGVRYALFIAAVAIVIAWLALWDQLLTGSIGDHTTTLRWLLLLVSGGLVGASLVLPGRDSEIVTGAILAAVGAGAISGLALFGGNPFVTFPEAHASFFWSLELLVVALAGVVYGAGTSARGPVYAGALGLALFTLIIGLDLAHTDSPDGTLLGWPLALLGLGLGALAAGLAPWRRDGERPAA